MGGVLEHVVSLVSFFVRCSAFKSSLEGYEPSALAVQGEHPNASPVSARRAARELLLDVAPRLIHLQSDLVSTSVGGRLL